MTLIILYVATALIFLTVDYVGLSYLVKPVFEKDIAHLMIEDIRLAPAAVFYAFLVAVLVWFVSWPALVQDRGLLWVLGNAALIGALAYGTFEFTALTILKDWTWRMVWTDVIWGTVLTMVSAAGGVWAVRLIG